MSGGIPQRPPRQNRNRSESASSPTISGSQYFQHYQHPPQQQQQDQYYASSSHSHSPRPSPRSTPNTYGYTSQQPPPPSPMSFQLPPSAFASRDDSLRSGSIPYPPNANPSYHPGHSGQIHQNSSTSSGSSYRSPHMSPGLPSSVNLPNVPPLTLPDSFLEDQSDYAGYYSDVGAFSTTQILPQQHMLQPAPLNTTPLPRQQSFSQGDSPLSPSRQGHRSGPIFLPSPHLTPTASPLLNDFSSMSLGKDFFLGSNFFKCLVIYNVSFFFLFGRWKEKKGGEDRYIQKRSGTVDSRPVFFFISQLQGERGKKD